MKGSRYRGKIVIWHGLRGSGKTVRGVIECIKEMKRGTHVISNQKISIIHKNRRIDAEYINSAQGFEDAMIRAEKAIVFIDEGGSLMPAEFYKSIKWDVVMKIRESRKDKLDLWITAQTVGQVFKGLRTLVDETVFCKRRPGFLGSWRLWYIRWEKVPLLYKTMPNIFNKFIRAAFTKDKKKALFYRKGYIWLWQYVKHSIVNYVPSYVLMGYHSGTGLWSRNAKMYGKVWWQDIWFVDKIYPSDYFEAMASYNTRLKTSSKFSKYRQTVGPAIVPTNKRNTAVPPVRKIVPRVNTVLIAKAEKAIAQAQQEIKNTAIYTRVSHPVRSLGRNSLYEKDHIKRAIN